MAPKHHIQERSGLRGIITFSNFLISGRHAREIDEQLAAAHNLPPDRYRQLVSALRSLCTVRTRVVHNRIVLPARSMMVGRLIGDTTYTGTVNYGAVGTDDAAVTDLDTALGAEIARAGTATQSQTDDQISLDFYFSKASGSGTFEEFGLFVDGNSSPDTGLMFNRALTGGWVKSSLEAMTVSAQITLSAS